MRIESVHDVLRWTLIHTYSRQHIPMTIFLYCVWLTWHKDIQGNNIKCWSLVTQIMRNITFTHRVGRHLDWITCELQPGQKVIRKTGLLSQAQTLYHIMQNPRKHVFLSSSQSVADLCGSIWNRRCVVYFTSIKYFTSKPGIGIWALKAILCIEASKLAASWISWATFNA